MERRKNDSRFPDLHNPPKPRWKDALKALWGPAERLHQFRNLHTSMFDEAMCEMECRRCE